jgi:hypothetical protein
LVISAVALLGVSNAALAQSITLAGLGGEWRVYQTELDEPDGVQAYSTEQLEAIVGNRLLVGPEAIRWAISHGQSALREHESFNEVCVNPKVRDMGDKQFQISCRGDDIFAPGLTTQRNGDLVIIWWDGVTLYLRKDE